MSGWLKTLTGSLCVLTILLHLVPAGKFASYVRFYAGLLFFLVAVSPLLDFFFGEGELTRLLKLEFLKEEYYDVQTSIEGMEDLKNDRILEAYRTEIKRQIREIASACGLPAASVELSWSGEDEYALESVRITAGEISDGPEAVSEIMEEIAGLFALDQEDIHIIGQGAKQSEAVDR